MQGNFVGLRRLVPQPEPEHMREIVEPGGIPQRDSDRIRRLDFEDVQERRHVHLPVEPLPSLQIEVCDRGRVCAVTVRPEKEVLHAPAIGRFHGRIGP
jgi:hypothetical protein